MLILPFADILEVIHDYQFNHILIMLYHYDLSKKWTHVGKIRWKGLQCDSLFWRSSYTNSCIVMSPDVL